MPVLHCHRSQSLTDRKDEASKRENRKVASALVSNDQYQTTNNGLFYSHPVVRKLFRVSPKLIAVQ